jgi:hypothetical protein
MRPTLLAALFGTTALISAAAFAQTSTENPPSTAAPPRGVPANICQELVAFLTPKPPPPASAATPAPQAAAAPAQTGPAPQAAQTGSPLPQGGSAPAVEAAKVPPPTGQNATPPQTSGLTAPVPQAPPAPKPPPVSLDEAKSLAQGNDIKGCRDAARTIRLAGIAMPAGLLALAAMREDLLLQGAQ